MKAQLRIAVYMLAVLFTLAGCKKDKEVEEAEEAGKEQFVSAAAGVTYTKANLQALATVVGFSAFVPQLQYDVTYYRITYNTTLNGKKIQASGLLGVPQNTPAAPAMLSAQHGTMFSDSDAPSNFPSAITGFELFASAGFVTVIPDFIGYGVSKDLVHPYYDMESSGLAVVDLIKAAKYYLTTLAKPVAVNDKLFLVGYSEGGYVTMAAQREIETNATHKLTVTAAAEGAGGYDITGMLAKVATVASYPDPSFFALFMMGYNTTYGYNRPLTDFFKEPYASKIPQLLNGTKNSDQVNAELVSAPASLFSTTFYNSLSNPAAETAFKAKVAANSFPNWYPKSATRLYHGTADQNVYFETSQTTYARFVAAGSTKLTLIPVPNGTHETTVIPMMGDALTWFKTLAQ